MIPLKLIARTIKIVRLPKASDYPFGILKRFLINVSIPHVKTTTVLIALIDLPI